MFAVRFFAVFATLYADENPPRARLCPVQVNRVVAELPNELIVLAQPSLAYAQSLVAINLRADKAGRSALDRAKNLGSVSSATSRHS
jgi:hypothetical protein